MPAWPHISPETVVTIAFGSGVSVVCAAENGANPPLATWRPAVTALLNFSNVQTSREELLLLGASALLVMVATAIMWRVTHTRQKRALVELREREQRLAVEHALRLEAERGLRALTQRLLTAQEDERSHLARELHDDITQRLARLSIDAAQLERGLPLPGSNGHPRSLRDELARLSADVHRFSHRLHPSILDELGLAEAIRAECDHLTQSGCMTVKADIRELPQSITREVSLCLFRVAQESLRNAARHSSARTVEVSLLPFDGGLQLAVRDDGVGFKTGVNGRKVGLGHASMKERVELLGGELDIDSVPGNGTTVLAWVPLQQTAAA